jgi:hypothetical protein
MFLLGTPIVRAKTLSISGYEVPSSYHPVRLGAKHSPPRVASLRLGIRAGILYPR